MALTSKSRKWKWLHSLWVIWTFTLGTLGWIAFMWIGFRARRLRWFLWGFIYLIPFVLLFTTDDGNDGNTPLENTVVGSMILVGVITVVHAFIVRDDYLVRLDARQEARREAKLRKYGTLRAQIVPAGRNLDELAPMRARPTA